MLERPPTFWLVDPGTVTGTFFRVFCVAKQCPVRVLLASPSVSHPLLNHIARVQLGVKDSYALYLCFRRKK